MLPSSPLQGPDMLVLGAPLILLLVLGFFRLDTLIVASKTVRSPRRRGQPADYFDDSAMHTDPDGRPWDQDE